MNYQYLTTQRTLVSCLFGGNTRAVDIYRRNTEFVFVPHPSIPTQCPLPATDKLILVLELLAHWLVEPAQLLRQIQ